MLIQTKYQCSNHKLATPICSTRNPIKFLSQWICRGPTIQYLPCLSFIYMLLSSKVIVEVYVQNAINSKDPNMSYSDGFPQGKKCWNTIVFKSSIRIFIYLKYTLNITCLLNPAWLTSRNNKWSHDLNVHFVVHKKKPNGRGPVKF